MSVSCDPKVLVQLANSLQTIPVGRRPSVKTYLLCQKALSSSGGGGGGLVVPAQVQDWVARVIANGGPVTGPNNQTLTAAVNLYNAMSAAGILSLMKTVNIMAPPQTPGFDINHYSLSDWAMARTPFIKGVGTRDPYTTLNDGGSQAQLGTYGFCPVSLAGSGGSTGETMFTGIVPSAVWGVGDGGLTVYMTRYSNQTLKADFSDNNTVAGCADGAGFQPANTLLLWQKGTNNSNFQAYANGTVVAPTSPQKYGFYSGSRISNADSRLYFANSVTAFSQVGSNLGVNATVGPNSELELGGIFDTTSPLVTNSCNQFIGFFAAHSGLTLAQTQAFYNAVQAYMVAVGTGAV